MSEMSDAEFARAFLAGAIMPQQFHHRDHLRVTWYLIRERGAAEAGPLVAAAIRGFAERHGHVQKYHETMTRFWVWAVGRHVAAQPDLDGFDAFLAAFPALLDTSLPYRHWNRETMMGDDARVGWVEPDLLALPV